jgi:hypothetical protein
MPENLSFLWLVFIRHAGWYVIEEIEMADISIILGFYSMYHPKVVIRGPINNVTFVCSIVWKSRIIHPSPVPFSLITGNTRWKMKITQHMTYLGAFSHFFQEVRDKPSKSHFLAFRTVSSFCTVTVNRFGFSDMLPSILTAHWCSGILIRLHLGANLFRRFQGNHYLPTYSSLVLLRSFDFERRSVSSSWVEMVCRLGFTHSLGDYLDDIHKKYWQSGLFLQFSLVLADPSCRPILQNSRPARNSSMFLQQRHLTCF